MQAPTPQERRALRQADPSADWLHVPTELRDIDDALVAWGRWCAGRPSPETSPMFRLFRQTFARASYGAPTPRPSVDAGAALKLEKVMRYLPERARQLLRGWYVLEAHPRRLCRFVGIRPSDLAGELNAARRMVVNLLRRH
jgi:hypothetical protein